MLYIFHIDLYLTKIIVAATSPFLYVGEDNKLQYVIEHYLRAV